MSRIIKVKAIDKKDSNWMGFVRYRNTKDYITPYYDQTGTIITGLTKEDEEALGKELRVDLSKNSPFWHEYKIVMMDKPKEFNLDNPEHQLAHKFLLAHKRVKNSPTEANPYAEYEIVDENLEAEIVNMGASYKVKANLLFSQISMDQKRDILKLYPGFTNTLSVSPEVIDARLYEQLEKNPAKFISYAEDAKRDMKVLLKDLIQAGILRKNRSAYYYGDDCIGHDDESTITYLEDPEHQGLKLALMQELEKVTGISPKKAKK